MRTGICSITFRKLAPEQVVELSAQAGLDAIEWGGDVHAAPDKALAELEEIGGMTRQAGLFVSSYGSYHKVMDAKDHSRAFEPVLDAADALATPIVRVWTSGVESADADDAYFGAMAQRVRDLGGMASERGITLAFEFHRKALTDTVDGTKRLIDRVGMDNVRTYWQPLKREGPFSHADELRAILPYLVHVHCYHWTENYERRLLAEGRDQWMPLLRVLAEADFDNVVMLEFTKDDAPENMLRDASALKEMVAEALA